MFKKSLTIILFTAFSIGFSSLLQAEESAILFTNKALKQIIKKDKNGKVTYDYVTPDLVLPNDIILYNITFENISDKDVTDIVINNPIANNSIYRRESATGKNTVTTFSIDGKKYATEGQLVVKDKNGKVWTATEKDYSHIRWVYKKTLKPGEKSQVNYKTSIRN